MVQSPLYSLSPVELETLRESCYNLWQNFVGLSKETPLTNNITIIQTSKYKSLEKKELVKNKKSIDQNINDQKFKVIDARSKERFEGKVPEPRNGLRSGNIKNIISWTEVLLFLKYTTLESILDTT